MSTLQGQGCALNSPNPTITAAPDLHVHIPKRQAAGATCTEWSYIDGGAGPVICDNVGESCSLDPDGTYVQCQPETATNAAFITTCIDYGSSWSMSGDTGQIGSCSAAAPFCATLFLVDDDGFSYKNFACGTKPYLMIATQVAPLPSGFSVTAGPTGATSTTAEPSLIPTSGPSVTATIPSTTSLLTSSSSGSSDKKTATIGGAIGGILGGLAALACGIAIWFYMRKKRQKRSYAPVNNDPGIQSESMEPGIEPANNELGIQMSMQSPLRVPGDSGYKQPFSSVDEAVLPV